VLLATALAACYGFSRLASLLPTSAATALPGVIRALSVGLFLMAAVLRLARWRLTGDAHAARGATALTVIGAALASLPLVGPLVQHSPSLVHSAPAARLMFVVPVLVLLTTETRPVWGVRERPLLLAVALFAGWVAVSLAIAGLRLSSERSVLETPAVWQVAECLAAVVWAALAVRTWWRDGVGRRPACGWIAIGLLLMGVGEALRAWTLNHHPSSLLLAISLQLIVAAIAVAVAGNELRGAFDADAERTDDLTVALAATQLRLDRAELRQERIHDARSAVAGVLGAARLLAEPAGGIDAARLRGLMQSELHRLQQSLVETDVAEPITDFQLAETLEPVVLSHRLAGGFAGADFGRTRVVGRPLATAAALANLLANVRNHAPGARVEIRAERQGATVVLTVEDDGPGIPRRERAQVFRRGVQGSAAGPGSGLGLYTAAQTMIGQSGSLRLTDRLGGGTRVLLTMPMAESCLSSARAS
jgi:signal transduction histidine kinase